MIIIIFPLTIIMSANFLTIVFTFTFAPICIRINISIGIRMIVTTFENKFMHLLVVFF